MANINRFCKDRLFKALFGSKERKELTLELYNAINHTNYENPEEIRINTMEDVIYMGMKFESDIDMSLSNSSIGADTPAATFGKTACADFASAGQKNDASFFLLGSMNLYEQQSTDNPNMPVRFFLYAAHLYEKYLQMSGLDAGLYGTRKLKLPAPRLVMLYNGISGKEKEGILKLSDLLEGAPSDIEVQVHVLNVNYESGAWILEDCKSLRDYAYLVEQYRKNRELKGDVRAVNDAIEGMEEGPVREYLRDHRSEVIGMLLTEYDEERVKRYLYQEAWEDGQKDGMDAGLKEGRMEGHESGLAEGMKKGLAEGEKRGTLKTLLHLVKSGTLTVSAAAACAGISEEAFRRQLR